MAQAVSLIDKLEKLYDSKTRQIVIDHSFSSQIVTLLQYINSPIITITEATFDPPPEHAMDVGIIRGKTNLWGVPDIEICLSMSGELDVANVFLELDIASLALKHLAMLLPLDLAQVSTLDAVALNNLTATLDLSDHKGLKISSSRTKPRAAWDILGLSAVTITDIQCDIIIVRDEETGDFDHDIQIDANLSRADQKIPIEIELPFAARGWRIGLRPPGIELPSLAAIGSFLTSSNIFDGLPAELNNMTKFTLVSFLLYFDPRTPAVRNISFRVESTNVWEIAEHFSVKKVALALTLQPSLRSFVYYGSVGGYVKIGSLDLAMTIPIPLSGAIVLSASVDKPLPSLGEFAEWVGGTDIAAALPNGFRQLALTLRNVRAEYDLSQKSVTYLGVDIVTAHPLPIIENHLVLESLEVRLALVKVGPRRVVIGLIAGALVLEDIVVAASLSRPSPDFGWSLGLTEALVLPGIKKIAALVGGDYIYGNFPPNFDENLGSLKIEEFNLVFDCVSNKASAVSFDVETSGPWRFSDQFILQQLEFSLQVSGIDKQDGKSVQIAIQGELIVGGISIYLSAVHETVDAPKSSGWLFSGTTGQQEITIGQFIEQITNDFSPSVEQALPQFITSLAIERFSVTFDTGNKDFTLDCETKFMAAGTELDLTLQILLKHEGGSYTQLYGGTLIVGPLCCELYFQKQARGEGLTSSTMFLAAVQPGVKVDLRALVMAVDAGAGDLMPELSLDIANTLFLYHRPVGADATYLFGLALGIDLNLQSLPLVGPVLRDAGVGGIKDVQALYASAAVTAADVAAMNALLDEAKAKPPLPTKKDAAATTQMLSQGFNFAANLDMGDAPIALTTGGSTAPPKPPTTTPAPAPPISSVTQAPSQAPGKWFDIGKSFGPFQIGRIGMQYQNATLLFELDAGLALGPLAFSVQGLAIGSSIAQFSPVVSISGLGLVYNKTPLEISGAILRVPDDRLAEDVILQFDGSLVLKAEEFSLSAVGSYAQFKTGLPSLFVFAQLEAPLGGPPAFFVTGLMGGLGFNRTLAIPSQDEVSSFPLLVLAKSPAPGAPAAQDPTMVLKMLEGSEPLNNVTKAWITPQAGDYWLAAGLEFTSFELVKSRLLLIVEFGGDLQLSLLGVSTLQLPQPEVSPETYAYIEMMIRVVVQPSQGYFAATAILSRNSYVIAPECHLTGGFAFYLWFGDNPNAGQFVVTLGGYHPAFRPPSYYPQVPEVGFNWAVSNAVGIKGNAYFALTPSSVMAGGGLEVLFQDGDLRAWFTAQADFLASWQPFYYTACVSVSVGVSYRLDLLFCTKTVTVSLGADLYLWGPPMGGSLHVDLVVVSFSVDIGSNRTGHETTPLAWNEFKSLLPDAGVICRATVTGGLCKTQKAPGSGSADVWVVRGNEFSFETRSAIPASQLVHGADNAILDGALANGISIRPMNREGVVSTHSLKIFKDGEIGDMSGWKFTGLSQTVPDSLWGAPPAPFTQIPPRPAAKVIAGLPSGFAVTAPAPKLGESRGAVPLSSLKEEYLDRPGQAPLSIVGECSLDYLPIFDAESVGCIGEIMSATAKRSRDALFGALSSAHIFYGANDDLAKFAAKANHLFSESPLLQN
jgi:anti-anti-sigma regulatory factor